MALHKYCTVELDAEKVKRHILFKYGTITNYCHSVGITRYRLWQILNLPHQSKEVKSLQDLSRNLNVKIDDLLK